MSTLPHIVSRVNGMKISLLPGQASILHRFEQDQNKLFIASTSFNPLQDERDDANDLQIPASNRTPEEIAASTADPRPHSNVSKLRTPPVDQVAAAEQRALAAEQELAELRAQVAKPARAKKAVTVTEDAVL